MDSTVNNAEIHQEIDPQEMAEWQELLTWRGGNAPLLRQSPLYDLYAPLCAARQSFAIGHLAQSLDGRIATNSGLSRWLSGAADLLHTHRMRALSDAVVIGAGTVFHDDPQLTVRRCAGANPLRVVIDPERRLDGSQRIFNDGAASTLMFTATGRARNGEACGQAEVVPIACGAAGLDPLEMRRILAQRGLSWIFVEGGGVTVSHFLTAGALDRLQLTVVPMLIGSGRPSVILPEISDLRDSLRPRTRRFTLGNDIMIECDFHG